MRMDGFSWPYRLLLISSEYSLTHLHVLQLCMCVCLDGMTCKKKKKNVCVCRIQARKVQTLSLWTSRLCTFHAGPSLLCIPRYERFFFDFFSFLLSRLLLVVERFSFLIKNNKLLSKEKKSQTLVDDDSWHNLGAALINLHKNRARRQNSFFPPLLYPSS